MPGKQSYCQVGAHPIRRGHWVRACAVCGITFCQRHTTVYDPLPGDLVGCPEHAAQVAGMNEDRMRISLQERERRFNGQQ